MAFLLKNRMAMGVKHTLRTIKLQHEFPPFMKGVKIYLSIWIKRVSDAKCREFNLYLSMYKLYTFFSFSSEIIYRLILQDACVYILTLQESCLYRLTLQENYFPEWQEKNSGSNPSVPLIIPPLDISEIEKHNWH